MSLSSLRLQLPNVTSSLSFLKDDPLYDEEKPYYCAGSLKPEEEVYRTNLNYCSTTVSFHDLRGFQSQLDIERNGFAFIDFPSKIIFDGNDNESVRDYMIETMTLLKNKLAAEQCYCYSYRFRRSKQPSMTPDIPTGTRGCPDEAANNPHVVYIEYSSQNIPELTFHGVWRPLYGKVEDDPLAICDCFTIDPDKDLVAADRISPGQEYVGEIYYVKHNEQQKWYYLSSQTPEELLAFVSFDSERDFGPACKLGA
ncbi:hypothetical protein BP5796_09799 [Coleophoma crateriformis]|uniref:Uncharacterized protein n=1 Tax=Coleophoma crateriformis TaxID=565419 RepID=A0A3D8QZF0_9HELO|nr:hypothetical protein BP5796_09799 [Coleophoma crateriformis]